MKKKLKIIIPVLVIVIIAIVAAIVVFTGNKFAFTDKSKVSMGLSKTMNSFTVSDDIKDEFSDYKYAKNMENNPYEAEIQMSIDSNIDNLDGIGDETLTEVIKTILEEVSDANITLKLSMDSKDRKGTMGINLDAENIIGNISGDVAFTSDEIAFRSKDLNEQYITVSKEDIEDEDFQNMFDMIDSLFDMNYSKIKFTKEEIKYLKDTYGSIFEGFITNDMMNSEKSEFEVNGKSKSCTKEILTIENDKLKELLNKYIETYQNDEKGKEIIENKINSIYGEVSSKRYIEQINDMIDDLKDAIDDIENTKIEFVTYCSLTEVYGTEIILTIDGDSASIKETFNDNETKVIITIVDEEIADFSIKNNKNEMTISGKIAINDNELNIDITIATTKIEFAVAMNQDGEKLGSFEVSCDINTKKNTEKEFEQSAISKLAIDVPGVISGDFSFDMNEKINIVNKIEFPDFDNSVKFADKESVNEYFVKCKSGLEKYMKTLQESTIYKILEGYGGSLAGNIKPEDLYKTTPDDVPGITSSSSDIEEEINDWVENLDGEEDLTTSEIIEQNMITEFDFSSNVSLDIYTSWKEGEATNEGFLGLNVSDEAGEESEFYLDLSTGTVYTEDNAPTEIENIEWNVFE